MDYIPESSLLSPEFIKFSLHIVRAIKVLIVYIGPVGRPHGTCITSSVQCTGPLSSWKWSSKVGVAWEKGGLDCVRDTTYSDYIVLPVYKLNQNNRTTKYYYR